MTSQYGTHAALQCPCSHLCRSKRTFLRVLLSEPTDSRPRFLDIFIGRNLSPRVRPMARRPALPVSSAAGSLLERRCFFAAGLELALVESVAVERSRFRLPRVLRRAGAAAGISGSAVATVRRLLDRRTPLVVDGRLACLRFFALLLDARRGARADTGRFCGALATLSPLASIERLPLRLLRLGPRWFSPVPFSIPAVADPLPSRLFSRPSAERRPRWSA